MSQEKVATDTAAEQEAEKVVVSSTEDTEQNSASPAKALEPEKKLDEAVIVEKPDVTVNAILEKSEEGNPAMGISEETVDNAIEESKEMVDEKNDRTVTETVEKNMEKADAPGEEFIRQDEVAAEVTKQPDIITLAKKKGAKFIENLEIITLTTSQEQMTEKPENETLSNNLTLTKKNKETEKVQLDSVEDENRRVDPDQCETDLKAKEKCVDNDSDSDRSIPSIQSQLSYLKQEEFEQVPDFLQMFGEIPDIEDISSGDETDGASHKIREEEIEEGLERTEYGHFSEIIDLVPEDLEDEKEKIAKGSQQQAKKEETKAEEDMDDLDIEDDELLAFVEQDKDEGEIEVKAQTRFNDTVLENFFSFDIEKKLRLMKANEEVEEQLKAKRHLTTQIEEFLYDLINHIVALGELLNPHVILRRNLDKFKLMEELDRASRTLEVEQKSCLFLNRKAVEFFRRKKSFRAIIDDNPETIMQDIAKYKESVAYLDHLLGTETDSLHATTAKLQALKTEESEMQEISRNAIKDFEELVKKVCGVETKPKLLTVIDSLLGRIEESRKEISDLRFILIQKQHRFAVLTEKLEKLEHIGEGLLMKDYDNLHRETLGLDKKNEERYNELHKLRNRYNSDLHIKGHMKEKQLMMLDNIAIQREALDELMHAKQSTREYLYSLKVKRSKVRKDIQDIYFQGGLLYKPSLMFDYDKTVERLRVVEARVTQMKKKHAETLTRIQSLERKCDDE